MVPGNYQTGQIMTIFLGMELRRNSNPVLPSIGCQAAGFYHDCRLLVFKIIAELGRGVMGIEQGKIRLIYSY